MDQIAPFSTARTMGGSAPAPAEAPAAGSILAADFQTFLRLLTTQLKHQDPLNPQDATGFAHQLATFSGVEQQIQTNQLLGRLVGAEGGTGASELAAWIGREVRAPGTVPFDGAPIELFLPVPEGTARARLLVHDSTGTEVERHDLAPSASSFTWTGRGEGGAFLPGDYSFHLEILPADAPPASLPERLPTEAYGRVVEARREAGGPLLVLSDGRILPAANVGALREPRG